MTTTAPLDQDGADGGALTAQEAKEYGIVDQVIQSRKLNALPAV